MTGGVSFFMLKVVSIDGVQLIRVDALISDPLSLLCLCRRGND